MNAKVEIFQQSVKERLGTSDQLTLLAQGFQFAEGPVWHPEGYLLFSDIPANRIFMACLTGVCHAVCQHSGGHYIDFTHLSKMIGSNGLALDKNRHLYICQHGNHGISKLGDNKIPVMLCSSYNGKPLNSPNDLVIATNGAVYFTDPPYGLKDEKLNPDYYQPHAGIYRYYNNGLQLLCDDLKYPNGICFSPDEQFLYVSNSDSEDECIYRFRVSANGFVTNRIAFASVHADGIKTDSLGNLYAATKSGVVIYSEEGEKLAHIYLPEPCTNLAFGGKGGDLLFITTYSSVYYYPLQPLPAKLQTKKVWKKYELPALT